MWLGRAPYELRRIGHRRFSCRAIYLPTLSLQIPFRPYTLSYVIKLDKSEKSEQGGAAHTEVIKPKVKARMQNSTLGKAYLSDSISKPSIVKWSPLTQMS